MLEWRNPEKRVGQLAEMLECGVTEGDEMPLRY